jgi:uncharacterized protein (TIGR02145 family)
MKEVKWVLIAVAVILFFAYEVAKIDSFTDRRDGRKYKYVKIGTQTWMAENLDYAGYNHEIGACYKKKSENCKKYGALYAASETENICPPDWHLPSIEEWLTLIDFAGNEVAVKKLKAKKGWNSRENNRGETISGNGTDYFGFAALPGGFGNSGGSFDGVGNVGNWWVTPVDGFCFGIDYYDDAWDGYDKDGLHSVRCLQD